MSKSHSTQKSKLSALPEEYNQLLRAYVEILEKIFPNPYELSLKKRTWDWFNIRAQIEYARSPYIADFVKTPNALVQELPGASEILNRLDKFDNDSLRTLAEMNSMNLSRLKRRSVTEAITPGIAFVGSVIGLLPAFQSVFPISLNGPLLSWIPQITISLLLKILLVVSFLIGIGNQMITRPRIGIVEALGGILNIAAVYRKAK